jgi:plasmid stabilization system protein ParE
VKVEISPPAQEDLDTIRRWIARDSRSRAISFTRELVGKIRELRSSFARYPQVDPARRPGLHRMNYRDYRIFYRVGVGTVEVLHVHHGRRGTPDFAS